MTDQTLPGFYLPNKLGRIILLSLEEVLGRKGVNAILNQAGLYHLILTYPEDNLDAGFPFETLSQLMLALEHIYGVRAGRGVALRSGRAAFQYGLRELGPGLGLTDMNFRLLPLENKMAAGAEIFANVFNRYSDQRIRIEMTDDKILWHIDRCPLCWQREADVPVCHMSVGLLQEALFWVSNGKYYSVEETACVAKGDAACTIEIEKQYLE